MSHPLDLEIPRLAASEEALARVEQELREAKSRHDLYLRDARDLSFIADESLHLVVTSPPYWNLKKYNELPGQLGNLTDYEKFLDEITKVWKECFRVLVPGGRVVIVVGDVCLARKRYGRHLVMPLHADIVVRLRKLGFDNLAPIIWYKIANIRYEVKNGSRFLGKPYEPNAVIKNDIEFILMERKPGGYRKPTPAQRCLSVISKSNLEQWFQQIWRVHGESTRGHPAPFPLEIASRLVRMFSFVGDTVLDPFCGTGTTMLAALETGRNSIGMDIDPVYTQRAARRLSQARTLFSRCIFESHGF